MKTGNWVRYCIFDLATGKAEQENNFPTSSIAFLGQNERSVAIFTAGQVGFIYFSLSLYTKLHFVWACLMLAITVSKMFILMPESTVNTIEPYNWV